MAPKSCEWRTAVINRIVATIFIFICSAVAWAILGGTIFIRNNSASVALNGHVRSIWGSAQVQSPPAAAYIRGNGKAAGLTPGGTAANAGSEAQSEIQLPIQASLINVDFGIDYRQKGLLWYSTYRVRFSGTYTFQNPTDATQNITFRFPLPAKQAIYDDMKMAADDQPLQLTTANGVLAGSMLVAAGNTAVLHVSYRSQGLDTWQYKLGDDVAEVKTSRWP